MDEERRSGKLKKHTTNIAMALRPLLPHGSNAKVTLDLLSRSHIIELHMNGTVFTLEFPEDFVDNTHARDVAERAVADYKMVLEETEINKSPSVIQH